MYASHCFIWKVSVGCRTSKFLCPDLFFLLFLSLFPSISRYKRSHTRADKQDGNSNDDPAFSPTHFHSVKLSIPRVLSALIMMALTRIYAPSLLLCLFILAHCLDPYHGDNKTDIDQSVLACSHTFNVRSSSPHSPSRTNTCHRHLRRPYCRQQAPCLTFCARLTIKRSSSLELPLPARF